MLEKIINSIKYNDLIDKLAVPKVGFMDIIEMMILAAAIYYVLSHIKDTRAWVVLKGVLILMLFYAMAYLLSFSVIMSIFQAVMWVFAIGIIILFQKELRKILEVIGRKKIRYPFGKKKTQEKYITDSTTESIVDACVAMSEVKTGALIVLKKDTPLNEFISTGITLDADISNELLQQIFEHNTPLHDGAVIIENNKIVSATCYLPLTENPSISKELGTRHRAGIGISETADCLVLIVSEETGGISVAENGKISRHLSKDTLREKLCGFQQKKKTSPGKSRIKSIIENKKLKLCSAAIGAFLWIMFTNINDPVITRTIYNIPVNIINDEVFADVNKTYSIGDEKKAKIVIKGRRSVADRLTPDTIAAFADLSKMSEINTIPVNMTLPQEVEMVENNNYLKITIEDLSTTEQEITAIPASPANNVYISSTDVVPSTINITGPKSTLNKIGMVRVEGKKRDISDKYTEKVKPVIYDKNGSVMDTHNLKLSDESVKLVYHTLPVKEVPLNLKVRTKYPEGEITTYSTEKHTVKIAADQETLDRTENISVNIPLDLPDSMKKSNMIKETDISEYISDGIYMDDSEKKININFVYVPYAVKTIRVPASEIKIKGTDKDYNYKLKEKYYDLTISGLEDSLMQLDMEDVVVYINVKNKKSAAAIKFTDKQHKYTLVGNDNIANFTKILKK